MAIRQLHIYHVNDLHSHLEQWPSIVAFFNKQRDIHELQNEEALFFDIGDHADRFHPVTEATSGKANVELMNEAGLDYATIGNNEGITFSKQQLNQLYDDANFPVLVANLFDGEERPHWAQPYEIRELDSGLKVAVIGMTVAFYPFYKKLGWEVSDAFEILPPLLEEVRAQADLVILVSHLGLNKDEELARHCEGIDIILGAHTHHLLKNGKVVEDTLIGQAGKFGHYLGQMLIRYDDETGEIVDYNLGTVEVGQQAPDQHTSDCLERLKIEADQILSEPVTTLSEALPVSWYEPSPFPELLAEALKEWCDAEISMVNAGVLLASLPAGDVTKGDLHRICPHPINPCKLTLKGSLLKETIQHAFTEKMINLELKGYGFRGKVLGVMAFSGVDVRLKVLADGMNHVESITVLGEPLDAERDYELATVDMYTFGRLYPAIAAAADKEYFMPEMLRDLLAWKLQKI
ncbi:bifunctional metallophosphatase/5'-nucleotidase [Desertibacillus haloalkaliphilus]|uniref:bifunctional metallophosphatase/5'-nucleotidase n=1 Tax=Desertibacillus haloalkaliphilus TaxID=1328930 RepID=UPI001C255559|nr:bifunctional UDP-sugar hydrolase/5'-nucleotidase [Desertibacillus haloalkaliphilus]MBU8906586.1 bifunctional metallophosphatase/5'-nucleotidase [Desertibacillus haloalkaliphilus]